MARKLLSGHPAARATATRLQAEKRQFTYADIEEATGFAYGKVQKLVRSWREAGADVAHGLIDGRTVTFVLVEGQTKAELSRAR